jgi:hypothetical protein
MHRTRLMTAVSDSTTVFLGQSGPETATFTALLWFGAIVLAFLLMLAVMQYARRRVRSSGRDAPPTFTLEELRRLRDQGRLDEAEYEAIKERTLHSSRDFMN